MCMCFDGFNVKHLIILINLEIINSSKITFKTITLIDNKDSQIIISLIS